MTSSGALHHTQVDPAIWMPVIRTGKGVDTFARALVDGLREKGFKAAISWLPLRAEVFPYSALAPDVPDWANIVHTNSNMPLRFLKTNGRPLVVTVNGYMHDPKLSQYKSLAQKAYHGLMTGPRELAVIRSAHKVVGVSVETRTALEDAGFNQPIELIYNGIDVSKYQPPKSKMRSVGQPFTLLFSGTWSRRKGNDTAVETMRQLGDDYRLLITDSAQTTRSLPPNCIPIGNQDAATLAQLYRNSDALLFPTRLEGLSFSVLEAQSSGLPVIGTRQSSVAEVVEDGVTGYLCEIDDPQSFASAVRRLQGQSDSEYSEMSKQAHRKVANRFSLNKMTQDYLAVYMECLTGGYPCPAQ